MLHELHYPILKDLGLTETEALIYEVLLEQGPKPAKDLVIPSGLSRGNVYNAVTALAKKGLATEKQGAKTIFEATPPSTLAVLLEREQSKLQQIASSFESVLPQMSKEYSFTTGKPVIQMFEGYTGAEKAIMDTLESGQEILTYLDIKSLTPEFQKINQRYVAARLKKQVPKKTLVEESPEARAFFEAQPPEYTEVRFVSGLPKGFKTSMQIYADTTLYLTLDERNQISVIIRDANISAMHRAHFMFLWNQAARLPAATEGSNAK